MKRLGWLGVLAFAAGVAKAEGPSFDCRKAKLPAEFAVCGNERLSELDRILVAGYNYIKTAENLAAADRIAIPYYFERRACGADAQCIAKSQINEIESFAASGAPVALPVWLTDPNRDAPGGPQIPLDAK